MLRGPWKVCMECLSWQVAGAGPETSRSSLVLKSVPSARAHPHLAAPEPPPPPVDPAAQISLVYSHLGCVGSLDGPSQIFSLPELPPPLSLQL